MNTEMEIFKFLPLNKNGPCSSVDSLLYHVIAKEFFLIKNRTKDKILSLSLTQCATNQ